MARKHPFRILFGIDELDPNDFYRDYEFELKTARKCGLPIAAETADEFIADVIENGLKIFSIDPSYGFSGWVICSEIEYCAKDEKTLA